MEWRAPTAAAILLTALSPHGLAECRERLIEEHTKRTRHRLLQSARARNNGAFFVCFVPIFVLVLVLVLFFFIVSPRVFFLITQHFIVVIVIGTSRGVGRCGAAEAAEAAATSFRGAAPPPCEDMRRRRGMRGEAA